MPEHPQQQSRVTRFFVSPEQIDSGAGIVTLDGEDSLHLDRVLRARPGDEIAALDGLGNLYQATLTSLSKSRVVAEIVGVEKPETEPNVAVTIAQALPKTAEKLEWVLQHGVEIGAAGFIVFRARRSEAGKLAEKPERWAKIVKTAAEQSGRAKLPVVRARGGLGELLSEVERYELRLLCDEAESAHSLRCALEARPELKTALIIVGPEGGWADEERAECIAAGVVPISLGKRILRTETAALLALSQILYASEA